MILAKRIYGYEAIDGSYSVFVDRLWPRGLSKSEAVWDEWLKEIAPSNELRIWFGHKPDNWNEFKTRYAIELSLKTAATRRIRDLEEKHGAVVLLYAAKDTTYNHANIIVEYLMHN